MTSVTETASLVEEILSDINEAEHRDRWVPHGFILISVEPEKVTSFFPEGAERVEVKLRIEVPVIFNAQNSRAVLPADRDNLNGLRTWIEKELRDRATRLEVARWKVSPDRDPKPQTKRDDPDSMWTVEVVIRER
jgi:hypothetical protein